MYWFNISNRAINLLPFTNSVLLALTCGIGHSQVLYAPVPISSITSAPDAFRDSLVQVTGHVVFMKHYGTQVDGYPYTRIEISDATDTIGLITIYPLFQIGDSLSVAGLYIPKRTLGRIVIGTNEIDARKGFVEVYKGGYEAIMAQSSNMSVPVMQVDTPESLTLYWLSLLGFVVAIVSIVPIIFRSRRFNVGAAISLELEPRLVVGNETSYISFALRLNKLSAINPVLSENIKLEAGGQIFVPDRVLDDRGERIKFPMELERSQSIQLLVSSERMMKHLSQNDSLMITIRDEYCRKRFRRRVTVNFIAHSTTPLTSPNQPH